MEIIAGNKKAEKTASTMQKSAGTSKKVQKVAKKTEDVKVYDLEVEPIVKKSKKNVQQFKIKKVVAKRNVPKRILKKIATLSPQDNSFLKEYYSRYYPADYVEALLANF
jgi:hypothetical protein